MICSFHVSVMAPIGQVHREHPRGLSSTRAHLRCAIDLYPQISVPSAGGESRPDEQLVTGFGKHLRHDLQVLIERCDVCAYTVHLLEEQKTACCKFFSPAGARLLRLG